MYQNFIRVFVLIFQCSIFNIQFSTAQPDSLSRNISAGIRFHYGFVIAHRPGIVAMQKAHLGGFDLNIAEQTTGRKSWHQHFGYPRLGFKFGYYGLGNKKELGHAYVLYPYADFDLARKKFCSLNLQVGWGLGYIDKPFTLLGNYKNVAIGSRANATFNLNISARLNFSDNDRLYAGLGLTHLSNASLTTPNLGVNLATISVQYSHLFGKNVSYKQHPIKPFNKQWVKCVYAGGFAKQVYPAGGNYFFAGTICADFVRRYSYQSGVGLGADYFYDESINHKLRNDDKKITPFVSASRLGINISYQMFVSKFTGTFAMGVYGYSNLSTDGSLYHRMGVRYLISKKLFATVNLKTHFAKADYLEAGLGYRW